MNPALGRSWSCRPQVWASASASLFAIRPPHNFLVQPCSRRGILTTTLSDPGFLAALPANLMAGIHEVGLPWLVALPLSAVAIRTAFIYPWFQKARRRNQAKLAMMHSLVDAEVSQTMTSRMMDPSFRERAKSPFAAILQKREATKTRTAIQRRLEKEYKAPTRPWSSKIVPVLILLTVSEAVRRFCGSERGLLGILCGPFQPVIEWIAKPVNGIIAYFTGPSIDDVHDTDPSVDGTSDSVLKATPQSFMQRRDDFQTATWTQQSMRTAGLPWCRDLVAPDPYKILPVLFSATFFASIWFSPGAEPPQNFYGSSPQQSPQKTTKPKRTFWQKVFLGLSVVSVIPAIQMPCALLVYFISNIAVNRLQTAWLLRIFPIIWPPLACAQRPTILSRTYYAKHSIVRGDNRTKTRI